MEILYGAWAGLDVHKETVVVWGRRSGAAGQVHQEVRTLGTMTRDLLALSDRLTTQEVTHVARDSTGVYWEPIFNILANQVQVSLVNAPHIRHVPGRKADVKDCEWIARLLRPGSLRAGFVPPRPVRELRDLTRQRAQSVQERARAANRIRKVLEEADLKPGSVATDILGASGRDMPEAIVAGETDAEEVAELARRRWRAKIPALRPALEGRGTERPRSLLRTLLDHVAHLETVVGPYRARIESARSPVEEAVDRLQTLPGVDRRAAEVIGAEIGKDMSQFPSDDHLPSWAGVCPGNDRGAGQRRSGRTTQGSRWLRPLSVQVAWAARRTKGGYFAARYRRLAPRRGKRRAPVALGHAILVLVYHLLKDGTTYQELGAACFEKLEPERPVRDLVRRLEKRGHKVTLAPIEDAA